MASVIKSLIKLLSISLVFSLLVPSVSEANGREQTYTVDPRTYRVDNPSDVDDAGWVCNDCVYRVTGVRDGDRFVFIVPFASSRILYYGRQEVGYSAELVNIEEVPVEVAFPDGEVWAPAIGREWNLPIGSYAKLIVTLSNNSFIGVSNGYNFESARLGITDSNGGNNWILFQFSNEGVWQGTGNSSVRKNYANFKFQRIQDECLSNLYLSLAEKKAQDLGNYEKCQVLSVNAENLNYINESLISQLPKYEDLRVEISKISGIYAKRTDFLRAFNSSVKARRSLTPSLYSEIGIKGMDGKHKGWIINRINESAPFTSSLTTIQDLVLKFAKQNLEIQEKRNVIKLKLKLKLKGN